MSTLEQDIAAAIAKERERYEQAGFYKVVWDAATEAERERTAKTPGWAGFENSFESLSSEVRYLRERLARMGERLARLEGRIAQLSPKASPSEYQTNVPFPFR